MAVFALRNADVSNGVSRLHGRVSRKMWSYLWPGLPEQEVPIESVTNGVHTQTWISREMRELFDRYLGPRWSRDPDVLSLWDAVEKIPTEVLWRTHEVQRQRLVSYVRGRLLKQLESTSATAVGISGVNDVLDAGALTIGSPAASPGTSAARCSCATPSASERWSRIRAARCNSSSPARRIRAMKPASV
jgi:starch phosphorylase